MTHPNHKQFWKHYNMAMNGVLFAFALIIGILILPITILLLILVALEIL